MLASLAQASSWRRATCARAPAASACLLHALHTSRRASLRDECASNVCTSSCSRPSNLPACVSALLTLAPVQSASYRQHGAGRRWRAKLGPWSCSWLTRQVAWRSIAWPLPRCVRCLGHVMRCCLNRHTCTSRPSKTAADELASFLKRCKQAPLLWTAPASDSCLMCAHPVHDQQLIGRLLARRARPSGCWQRATKVETRSHSSPFTAIVQSCCCRHPSLQPWPDDGWTLFPAAVALPWRMPCPQ